MKVAPNPDHPAPYTDSIIVAMRGLVRLERDRLGHTPTLLDPMAGVGRIHELCDVAQTKGVELEPEWAACHRRTRQGDARRLPRNWAGTFDIVATSPTYANRMADHHNAKDASDRHGYKFSLGREPSPGSSAVMQWGAEYRSLHELVVCEIERVLRDEGLFLLNISNHWRNKTLQAVTEWWVKLLLGRGWWLNGAWPIVTPRLAHGANYDERPEFEMIVALRRPGEVRRK